MYLRFETHLIDRRSNQRQGIFQAAGELIENADLTKGDHQLFKSALSWFNQNVHIPACLNTRENRRAVCWFKGSGNDAIKRVWDLVALLKEQGVAVRIIQKRELGKILYDDKWQVVALPKRKR
jgi:hypothetical protein